jgi:hypothetical protein
MFSVTGDISGEIAEAVNKSYSDLDELSEFRDEVTAAERELSGFHFSHPLPEFETLAGDCSLHVELCSMA